MYAGACVAVVTIAFGSMGTPGLVVAACVLPGVLLLWMLDRKLTRPAGVAKLPSAVAMTVVAAPHVASPATESTQASAATTLAERSKPFSQPPPPAGWRFTPVEHVDHFRRHEQTPGWLYAARNSHHCEDLYKLGYTTVATDQRINTLNEEHDSAMHVGSFEAVHSVPVESAYNAEQRLFELLRAYRVADKREFFIVQKGHLLRAMDGVSHESQGLIHDAAEWLASDPPPAMDATVNAATANATIPAKPLEGGYLLIMRNPWHAAHIYRLASTELDPHAYLDSANGVQRRHTSQIGFYALASVHAVTSPRTTSAAVLRAAHGHRIGHGSFVRMALADLSMLVQRCLAIESVARRSPVPAAPPTPTIDHLLAGESWHGNTCPYTDCFSNVRAAGAAGRTGELRCHECRRRVGYEIAANGPLVVWRDSY